jgi:hypothetical protein
MRSVSSTFTPTFLSFGRCSADPNRPGTQLVPGDNSSSEPWWPRPELSRAMVAFASSMRQYPMRPVRRSIAVGLVASAVAPVRSACTAGPSPGDPPFGGLASPPASGESNSGFGAAQAVSAPSRRAGRVSRRDRGANMVPGSSMALPW